MGDALKSVGGIADNVFGTHLAGDNATDRAINAQTSAANSANATSKYIYDQQRADQEPWRASGIKALAGLDNTDFQKDFTQNDFQKDPGYDFRIAEGQKALERSAAARGGLNSGATLKALARYGQDFASGEYNNAYNRFNADRDRRFNRLSSLAGGGQTATNQVGQFAGQYGQQVSGNQIGLGNAIGAAHIGEANRQAELVGQGMSALAMGMGKPKAPSGMGGYAGPDPSTMKMNSYNSYIA